MLRLAVCLLMLLGSVAAAQGPVSYGIPSTSAESSRVLKPAAGLLYGFQVNTGASALWVMVFDARTAPSNGAVTPVKWYQPAANSTMAVYFGPNPLQMTQGITIACSTTGPFTLTLSATCTISGETQ